MTTDDASPPEQLIAPAPCRSCGAPLDGEANFCGRCGASRAPPPIAYEVYETEPRRRPERRPQAWERLKPLLWLWALLLAVSLVAGLVSRAIGDDPENSLTIELGMDVAFIVIVLAFVGHRRAEVGALLRDHGFHRRAIAAVPVLVGMGLLVAGYFHLIQKLHMEFLTYLDDYLEAGWPLWIAFVSIAVVPAVFEELAFRGVIQSGLETVVRPGEALFLQAMMFSVLHLLPLMFPSHFVIGLALGWVRNRTRSLVPGMVAHFVWNAGVLVFELRGA